MRLHVAAVGKLKDGPERELFERYWGRIDAGARAVGITGVRVSELAEGRARDADGRRADEARRLAEAVGEEASLIVLDEGGRQLSSVDLARLIGERRHEGTRILAFAIGGPDGHDRALLARARLKLSLGLMTLPHGLARIVLAEQLYRATTILAGHPYHRA